MPKKIFVAGHRGMMGQAICRQLEQQPDIELITATRAELDLVDQAAVRRFFQTTPIDEVYLCAAKVGGIVANSTQPAQFIYQNLMVEANIIHETWAAGVGRLLFLGSSCIYPREAAQPMAETALLSGALEPTNEPYAIAKIAGIKMCESYNREYGCDFRSVMPTNLYGTGDNYHPENSHVIPALIRRFSEARDAGAEETVMWGTGTPRREFLHADDAAAASVFVMGLPLDAYAAATTPMCSHINVGYGSDVSIAELGSLVAAATGYQGRISFDTSKPDGSPRKLLDISKLANLGWQPQIALAEGLAAAVRDFEAMRDEERLRG